MTGKLLVTLDGSELAEAALPWALRLARAKGLALLLVRVVPWPTYLTTGADGYVSGEVYEEIIRGERDLATDYLEAFGGAVRRLLAAPSLAARLGSNARQRVRDEFLGLRHLLDYARLVERLAG